MATEITVRPGALPRARSSWRRDLVVSLAAGWMLAGLYLDGWAHSHVPELETFFTPWHGVLYSGYLALAVSLLPTQLLRGRPSGPVRGWFPAGYGLGVLGAAMFLLGGGADMTWHVLLGVETGLEPLLSPPHLWLLTGGALMIATPIRSAAARGVDRIAAAVPVIVSSMSLTALAAFFFSYLSPFTDIPAAYAARPTLPVGVASYVVTTVLVIATVLFVWTRLDRVPPGLITAVTAAAALPVAVFDDFANPGAKLWPLVGALLADVAVQSVVVSRPRLVPVAIGVLVPLLVWPAHLIGIQLGVGVAWSVELWGGVTVLSALGGAVLGGLLLPRAAPDPG